VRAFQVSLRAVDPADTVIGVDVEFVGTLYQVGWDMTDPVVKVYTPDMNQASTLTNVGIDTHFLLNQGGADWSAGSAAATEDNDFRYGPGGPTESQGLGSTLNVFAFISATARRQDLSFAQIVVPEGAVAYLTGAVSNGSGGIFNLGEGTGGIGIG
jgi:hypothetical protein